MLDGETQGTKCHSEFAFGIGNCLFVGVVQKKIASARLVLVSDRKVLAQRQDSLPALLSYST